MAEFINIPSNCRECEQTNDCEAYHYGGKSCKYANEINERILEETNKIFNKDVYCID